jgi:transcription elongation factor Elf1
LGSTRTAKTFRKDVVKFAKSALATENMKLASITNVTIDGNTIQIAVQTDAGEESVSIPIGEEVAPADAEIVPEGDLAGEGLESELGDDLMGNINNMASYNRKRMTRKAQSPMGGGMPGAGGGVSAPGAPESLDAMPPAQDGALQALTVGDEDEEILGDEIPTVGEKQAPWSICPECGTSDVDVVKEDDGGIVGNCNGCGAEYEALVKKEIEFRIIKPTKSVGEEGVEGVEGPEGPEEVPALPVAAQTRIDKNTIVRIAANKEANGDVCPSCGSKHSKVVASGNGQTKCHCGQCGTSFEKNLIVSSSDPSKGLLRVEWNLSPNESCPECKEEAKKFASKLKVAGLLKTASANVDQFPMSNCMERLARSYGGNTVARFGPCKGKPMADCVCKELQKLGFTKVRQLSKLAEVSMQEDPMDTCVKEQEEKGHDVVEAKSICNCLKKKFASETSDNIYAQAFSEEAEKGKIPLNSFDLNTLNEMYNEKEEYLAKKAQAILDEVEIGDTLEPLDTIEVEVEEVDAPAEDSTECVTIKGDNLEVIVEDTCEEEVELSDESEFVENEGEEDMETFNADALAEALAMNSSRVRRSGAETNIKLAGKPKQIATIEKDVEAGVPRANATIRNEGADNIDVKMAKPSVPRSKATMGQEGADNIDVAAGLPDVPVDSSYMGGEKEIQSGMPAINNEIKGTVIAEAEKNLREAQRQLALARKMKEVDHTTDDYPSGNARMGHEGADNIDVDMATPKNTGTSDSANPKGMGGENEAIAKADKVDIPIGTGKGAVQGEEVQVGPGIDDRQLKQVHQKRNEQLERIATARRDEALRTTAWLASNGRIASDKATFDNVVKALENFEVDKIASTAESMFPKKAVKTASTEQVVKTAGVGLPAIVLEGTPNQEATFQDKLEGAFTIGSHNLNNKLIDDSQR